MYHREHIEKEILECELFGNYSRKLFEDSRWRDLFEPRTAEQFREYMKSHPIPDEPEVKGVFENNLKPKVNEPHVFENEFDIRVFPAMRYNLGCIHYHDFYEISYLAKGSCFQQVTGMNVETQCGDFLVLAPGVSHYIQIIDDTSIMLSIAIRKSTFQDTFFGLFNEQDVLSLFFSRTLTGQITNQYLLFRTAGDMSVLDQLYDMYYESTHPIAYSRQALNNRMSDLFIYLMRYHHEHVLSSNGEYLKPSPILPILQYIQEKYTTVSLQELSDKFHYHPTYISEAIKKATAMSFNGLRQSLRMRRAETLLLNTDTPIQQIALELCFSDLSHFYRAFKQYNGLTPNQFREENSADKQ